MDFEMSLKSLESWYRWAKDPPYNSLIGEIINSD